MRGVGSRALTFFDGDGADPRCFHAVDVDGKPDVEDPVVLELVQVGEGIGDRDVVREERLVGGALRRIEDDPGQLDA